MFDLLTLFAMVTLGVALEVRLNIEWRTALLEVLTIFFLAYAIGQLLGYDLKMLALLGFLGGLVESTIKENFLR